MDRRRGRMDTCTRLLEGAQTAMRPGLLFRRDFLALASMAGVSVVFAPVRRAAAGPPSPNPYAATRPGQFSPAVAGIPERVYVPNTKSNTVDVIDPATFTRVGHFPVGATPHWAGVDHLDFSADGRFLLASCEYSGVVVKVDTRALRLVGSLRVGGLPVDV